MPIVRIEEVENVTEELIIAGMVTSTAYLAWVVDRFNERYIRNDQIRLISDLILEYYSLHKKAPKETIFELFESVVDYIDKDDAVIVEKILKNVSAKYGEREISFEVLSDTTEDYFEIRSVEVLQDKLNGLVKRGKIDDAKVELDRWYKDPKGVQSKAISPFDESFAEAVLEVQRPIFHFNNELDNIFPIQTKNKLYTFLGGTKSGKSQWLGWLASEFLADGLKVVVWEFELQQTEFLHRMLSAITGKGISGMAQDSTEVTTLPVFDCVKNRDGSCENPERPENMEVDDFSVYEEDLWLPCTACRGTAAFSPCIWKTEYVKHIINTPGQLKKEQRKWERQYGDNLKIFNADPDSGTTVRDMKLDLERLRLIDGFIPDVLIVDHADNLSPEKSYEQKRHELSGIWKGLSDLAKSGYLLWTASQTNRGGWNVEWLTTDMIAEDASKLMVADGTMTINQWKDPTGTVDEFEWCNQRLRAYFYRGQRQPTHAVMVTHDFSRYIACLDCARM